MGQRGSTQNGPSVALDARNAGSVGAAHANAASAQLAEQLRRQNEEIERQRLRALEEEKRNQSRAEIGRLKLIFSSVAKTRQGVEQDASAFDALLSILPENDFSTAVIFLSALLLSAKSLLYIMWQLFWLDAASFVVVVLARRHLTANDPVRDKLLRTVAAVVLVSHLGYFVLISFFDAVLIVGAAFLLFSLQDVQSSVSILRRHSSAGSGGSRGAMAKLFASGSRAKPSASSSSTPPANADSRTLSDAKYSDISAMLASGISVPVDTTRDGEDAAACSICLFNQPDVAFIPCGHVRCCVECVRSLCNSSSSSSASHKCPECRASIKQVFYPARR